MPDSRLTHLIAEGQLVQALSHLSDSRRQLSIPERVLRLELTSITSAKDSCASECSDLLSRRDLTGEDRVKCLVISAVSQLRSGSDTTGRASFKRAVAQADKIAVEVACYARVWQLSALVSWIGPEAASLEVVTTRRFVTAAGRPDFTVRFHLALAEIAAKEGVLGRAHRHLEVAADLLSSYPHQFLEAEHAVRVGAICTLASDPQGAATSAERAIHLAVESGAPTLEVVARSNLAHALLAQGKLQLCYTELCRAFELCRNRGGAELGIRDGLLQYALASNDLALADDVAEITYERSLDIHDGHSYYGLWHLLTRVKWLYRTDQAEAGVAIAMDALPRIERMADRNLLERM